MSKYLDFTIANYEKVIRNLERVERQIEYMSKIDQYVNKNLHGGAQAVVNTFIRRVRGNTKELWQITSLFTSVDKQKVVIKKVLGGTVDIPILEQNLGNEIVKEEDLNKDWQTVGRRDVEKELRKMETKSSNPVTSTSSDRPSKTASESPVDMLKPTTSAIITGAQKVGTSIVANETVYKIGQKIFLVKASVKSFELTRQLKNDEQQWVIIDLSGPQPVRDGFLVSTNDIKDREVPTESELKSVDRVLKTAKRMKKSEWITNEDLEIKTGIESELIEKDLLLVVKQKIEQLINEAERAKQELEEQKKSGEKLRLELEQSQTELAALKSSSSENVDKVSMLERNIESLERQLTRMNKDNDNVEAQLSKITKIN